MGSVSTSYPLNYYQILGLPPQCAFSQVEPAFNDRVAQTPRREFSAGVLSGRERVLQEACTVLADPDCRSAYHDEAAEGPGLVIPEPAVGLLLLYELGEYQQILEREEVVLNTGANPDVRLVLALTHRALAEDAYRQGSLSLAWCELDAAQNILQEGNCLLAVQQELNALTRRWRPERILQLLAGPPDQPSAQREEGFALLLGQLEERQGIEGDGNDQSGLSREEFVQFVQYVRLRLTVAEQQELFERESTRPSAGAQYLAAQALLARGFQQGQPNLVRRARGHLIKLSQRQDVNLELAVCALLLGQVEEAEKNVERSQEEQPVQYIRSLSEGSPDVLPGLCRYSEQWFEREVFPSFRDLRSTAADLNTYFANSEVQAYLDQPQQPAAAPTVLSAPPKVMPTAARRRPSLSAGLVPVALALVAVFLLGGGWLFAQRQQPDVALPSTEVPQVPAPTPSQPLAKVQAAPAPVVARGPEMPTSEQAAKLLQGWQAAKQQALGPRYQTAELQSMLTGRTRQAWSARVQRTREAREHWQYRLKELRVEQVAERTEREVEVTAEISEVANLYSSDQLQPSRSYDRPYRVRYLLVKEQAGWLIDEMKVL